MIYQYPKLSLLHLWRALVVFLRLTSSLPLQSSWHVSFFQAWCTTWWLWLLVVQACKNLKGRLDLSSLFSVETMIGQWSENSVASYCIVVKGNIESQFLSTEALSILSTPSFLVVLPGEPLPFKTQVNCPNALHYWFQV